MCNEHSNSCPLIIESMITVLKLLKLVFQNLTHGQVEKSAVGILKSMLRGDIHRRPYAPPPPQSLRKVLDPGHAESLPTQKSGGEIHFALYREELLLVSAPTTSFTMDHALGAYTSRQRGDLASYGFDCMELSEDDPLFNGLIDQLGQVREQPRRLVGVCKHLFELENDSNPLLRHTYRLPHLCILPQAQSAIFEYGSRLKG